MLNASANWGNKMKFLAITICLFGFSAFGSQMTGVSVSGDKEAKIQFEASDDLSVPTLKISDNVIELVFSGARLEETNRDRQNLSSPHPLIQRIGLFSADRSVKARVVLNGTVENLKNRVNLAKTNNG